MNTNPPNRYSCEQVLANLDLMMDGALETAESIPMEAHLNACAECQAELELRDRVRNRLRQAVRKPAASPAFEQRVRNMVHVEAGRSFRLQWHTMAAAAAVVIGLAGVVAYQVGYLRVTAAQQEDYVTAVAGKVSQIMRVGLVDHVHCSFFRKWPKEAPVLEDAVKAMEPKYRPIAMLVRQNIPADYRIVLAHHCKTRGRRFVHLSMRSGEGKLISLVLAAKIEGETFANSGLRASVGGLHHESAQHFQIEGFETAGYLGYVISNMDEGQNRQLAQAIVGPVQAFLATIG